MCLNPLGQIVDEFWHHVPGHFSHSPYTHLSIDAHATMPNHVHAIIVIHDPVRTRRGTVLAHWCQYCRARFRARPDIRV